MNQDNPSSSTPPPGSTFTIHFDSKEQNKLQLQTAKLWYNNAYYTGDVPSNSILNFGGSGTKEYPHWHFTAYVSLAYSWENTPSWQNFTKFDLPGVHMAQHSLGGVPPHTDGWEQYQLAGLFANVNFKATKLNMNSVQFEPVQVEAFVPSLVFALSKNTTLQQVSLIGTSPLVNTSPIELYLQAEFPNIKFAFTTPT